MCVCVGVCVCVAASSSEARVLQVWMTAWWCGGVAGVSMRGVRGDCFGVACSGGVVRTDPEGRGRCG